MAGAGKRLETFRRNRVGGSKKQRFIALAVCIVLIMVISLTGIPKPTALRSAQAKLPGNARLVADRRIYRVNERPSFRLKVYASPLTSWLGPARASAAPIVDTSVNYEGHPVDIPVKISEATNGEFSIRLEPKAAVKPGKYTLAAKLRTDEGVREYSMSFAWGVLAINTTKSVYLPGETVRLEMAVLSSSGHTLCHAPLKLTVTGPNGQETKPAVAESGACKGDSYVEVPDYTASYTTKSSGRYQMKLQLADSEYAISDYFDVREKVPFDIERTGPTRIYPAAEYTMKLRVHANQDFTGNLVEELPASFTVTDAPGAAVTSHEGRPLVSWPARLKAGEELVLQYKFRAPPVSPAFYFFKPLRLVTGEKLVYAEARQWQAANDATITFVKSTPHNVTTAAASDTLPVTSTAGNTLVLLFGSNTSSGTGWLNSVTDSAGNNWVIPCAAVCQNPPSNYKGTGGNYFAMAYAMNAKAVTSVSVATASGTALMSYDVAEFSNINNLCVDGTVDQSASSNQGIAGTQTTTSITTVNANDLIIGGMAAASTFTLTSAGTQIDSSASLTRLGAAYNIVAATGTYNFTFSLGTSRTIGTGIMAFTTAGDYIPSTDVLMGGGNFFCRNTEQYYWWL